jgi:predicted nucleic acid-binding protein
VRAIPSEVNVFLDTSALFAGIWSTTGGARLILKLGESRVIKLLVSGQVLKEIEEVLRKKSPDNLGYLTLLLDRSGINVAPDPSEDILLKCANLIPHQGDVQVIGSAWESEADYFVTLDRKHFLDNLLLLESIPFKMGTPGDFLEWYRGRLTTSLAN